MITPSRAGDFFSQLVGSPDPLVAIERLVDSPSNAGESEFVDYKAAGDLTFNDDALKKIWSISLSAYANTGGGVLILGIRAPDNIPNSFSLVKDAEATEARLKQLQPGATDPPIHGVDIRSFRKQPDRPEGFVVCLIPPSRWPPHMSIWGDHKYYIRSGDNCIPATHSILKALFQPSHVAQLSVFGRVTAIEQMGSVSLSFHTWLHNAGPSTARNSLLLFEAPKHSNLDYNRNDWRPFSSGLKGEGLAAVRSIHPGEMYPIIYGDLGHYPKGDKNAPKPPFYVTFKVFSEDKPSIEFELIFNKNDVLAGLNVKGAVKENA